MQSFENIEVSFQDNFWGKIITRTLYDVLQEIRNERYKSISEQLKSHYVEGDGLYSVKKRTLPVVTFCANFNDEARTKENLKNYNSIMIIDIDDLGLENVNSVFERLSQDEHLFAVWLSPSGNGIKGLIKLNFEENFEPIETDIWHYSAFAKLTLYFKEKYDIELDQSGKDFTRLCFICHDKNIIIKKNELVRDFLISKNDKLELQLKNVTNIRSVKGVLEKKEIKNILNNPLNRNSPTNKKEIQNIIKFLNKNNLSITYEYDNWLRVALGIASSFTYDLGINFFLELSKLDESKFNNDNCTNMLKECYINNKKMVKFSTLIHLAVNKGYVYKNNNGLESN